MIAVALFDSANTLLGDLILKDLAAAPDVLIYQQECYVRQGESHEYRQTLSYVVPDNQKLNRPSGQ